jgi:hypothetical protein
MQWKEGKVFNRLVIQVILLAVNGQVQSLLAMNDLPFSRFFPYVSDKYNG